METKFPAVFDMMSQDKFLKLLTLIHFQNNFSVSDDAKKDKLWKPWPWLYKLQEQFLHIPPEECQAVDEIMLPFKEKSDLLFYMPAKSHKWGFKMRGCAGQSGYLYDFDVCQGAENVDRWCYRRRRKKKSQGLFRKLFYISFIGATPKTEKNPLDWHSLDYTMTDEKELKKREEGQWTLDRFKQADRKNHG